MLSSSYVSVGQTELVPFFPVIRKLEQSGFLCILKILSGFKVVIVFIWIFPQFCSNIF